MAITPTPVASPLVIPVELDLTKAYAQIEELRAALSGAGLISSPAGPRVDDRIVDPNKLDSLPVGTVIEDCDGDQWTLRESGWCFRNERSSNDTPNSYAPFIIIEIPEAS